VRVPLIYKIGRHTLTNIDVLSWLPLEKHCYGSRLTRLFLSVPDPPLPSDLLKGLVRVHPDSHTRPKPPCIDRDYTRGFNQGPQTSMAKSISLSILSIFVLTCQTFTLVQLSASGSKSARGMPN